jgi:hypothetical protein
MSMHTRKFGIFLMAFVALFATQRAFADSPKVTAVLSNDQPAVGQTVQLEIKVSGANNAQVPEEISVDGLEIHQTGTSRQFEMRNFDVTSSTTYSYTVLPLKAGAFRIPPQTIRVGNSSLQTPELSLNVANAPNRGTAGSRADPTKFASAELIVPKKNAYVGEIIPVEIRMRFDTRAHPQLAEGPPTISGQGFTTEKMPEPQQSLETIGGRNYNVVTYKTAIAAARTGKFEIGPVETKVRVTVPREQTSPRARPHSPFDIFNMDDPFNDPFFNDPFGTFGERMIISVKSEPVTLDVKPLPPNAPRNFSGAIGNFTMTTEAKPTTVQIGDPITVTSTISGRGNFDRMNGPNLEDERGWHKYPPSSKFKQDDDVGISGSKTFETVIAPNEKKTTVPSVTFCYFDPVKENYVTLRSDPTPIQVQGENAPAVAAAPTSAATAAPAQSQTNAAANKPAAKPTDILYQLNELGPVRSFAPIYQRSPFWLIQIIPLVALLAFAGWKIRQTKIDNREAQRISARQQEMAKLVRELRRGDVAPQVYFSQAARVVQLKTALVGNLNPNVVDAELAATTFQLDEDSRARLRRLFERSDELRYSGTTNGNQTISPENRRDVLELVENLRA